MKLVWFGSETGIEEESSPTEDVIPVYYPTFPNPTTNGLSIHFSIPFSNIVSFAIYDASGRLVEEHASMYAPGNHLVEFNIPNPGIYFCRMTSGDFHATQRFVVIE